VVVVLRRFNFDITGETPVPLPCRQTGARAP